MALSDTCETLVEHTVRVRCKCHIWGLQSMQILQLNIEQSIQDKQCVTEEKSEQYKYSTCTCTWENVKPQDMFCLEVLTWLHLTICQRSMFRPKWVDVTFHRTVFGYRAIILYKQQIEHWRETNSNWTTSGCAKGVRQSKLKTSSDQVR